MACASACVTTAMTKTTTSPEAIARTLYAQFHRGFPKNILGDSEYGAPLMTAYEWICLIREQTGLTVWKEAEELALRIAPEFTAEYWEDRLQNESVKP